MGRDNHAANLGGMKQEYAELVAKINKYPVAYFEAKLRKVEDKHRYYSDDKNWQSSRFIRAILLGSLSSEIKYYKEMIDIKQRFGTLKPLRQLLKDEEALRAIFE